MIKAPFECDAEGAPDDRAKTVSPPGRRRVAPWRISREPSRTRGRRNLGVGDYDCEDGTSSTLASRVQDPRDECRMFGALTTVEQASSRCQRRPALRRPRRRSRARGRQGGGSWSPGRRRMARCRRASTSRRARRRVVRASETSIRRATCSRTRAPARSLGRSRGQPTRASPALFCTCSVTGARRGRRSGSRSTTARAARRSSTPDGCASCSRRTPPRCGLVYPARGASSRRSPWRPSPAPATRRRYGAIRDDSSSTRRGPR